MFNTLGGGDMGNSRSTIARGYNRQHKQERAKWAAVVKAGDASCVRCGAPIGADQPFDLDHTDDRTAYLGPSHVRCNRRAGAIKGNSRRWGHRKRWVL